MPPIKFTVLHLCGFPVGLATLSKACSQITYNYVKWIPKCTQDNIRHCKIQDKNGTILRSQVHK